MHAQEVAGLQPINAIKGSRRCPHLCYDFAPTIANRWWLPIALVHNYVRDSPTGCLRPDLERRLYVETEEAPDPSMGASVGHASPSHLPSHKKILPVRRGSPVLLPRSARTWGLVVGPPSPSASLGTEPGQRASGGIQGLHKDMAESTEALLKLREDLVWRQVGDEIMVLDTATSEYLSVNSSGALLWALLAEGCRPEDLVRVLIDRFGIDRETAEVDTQRFLSLLEEIKAFTPPAS